MCAPMNKGRMLLWWCGVLAAGIASSGCKKRSPLDVASVNALVPVKYKYKLEFEAAEITGGTHRRVTYVVPVPKHWTVDDRVGMAAPTDKLANGDATMWVHSSCDEEPCRPSDWNVAIDEELKLLDVLKDERGDHRRVVAVKSALPNRPGIAVKVYWWTDGASEFHACEASLGPGLEDAAPAFQKACELAIVRE